MAIYHDAYLFSEAEFAQMIQDIDKRIADSGLTTPDMVAQYMDNSLVLELCDNYGGWDNESILQCLFENDLSDDEIFILALYEHLSKYGIKHTGLGHDWAKLHEAAPYWTCRSGMKQRAFLRMPGREEGLRSHRLPVI